MISVVMPAYNAEQFIAQAIESILNQTYQELKLIIVEDGSTDSTFKIAQQYLKQDHRIQIIQNKQNLGISNSLNIGINASSDPWIAIMHADDIALPNRLEKQIEAASINPNVVVWGTFVYRINVKGDILSVSPVGPVTEAHFFDWRKKGRLVSVIHPTVLMKRHVVLAAGGYDARFDSAEDVEIFDRMANFGSIVAIPEPLVLYRIHDQSLTTLQFSFQSVCLNYLEARQKERLEGRKESSFDEFLDKYKQQPALSRLKRWIHHYNRLFYRKASLALGERHYLSASLYLFVSTLLAPDRSIARIWEQRLSPAARKALSASININKRSTNMI